MSSRTVVLPRKAPGLVAAAALVLGLLTSVATPAGAAEGPAPTPSERRVEAGDQLLVLSSLSAHYHQGSTILARAEVDPALGEGDTVTWQWRWLGQDWTDTPWDAGRLEQTFVAEQAMEDVELRARLTFGDGRDPMVSNVETIHIDDHGAAPRQQLSISGESSYGGGEEVELTASVSHPTVLTTYRWERKRPDETGFTVLDGEQDSTLTFEADAELDGTQFRVALMKPDGSLGYGPSPAFTLGVAAPDRVEPELDGQLAPAYTVELLEPTNDGVSAGALGVNDAGDVVGITRPTSSAQPQRTVLWERDGEEFVSHELANLEGSQFSRGFDLDDERTVVGEAFNSGGGSIPIRWEGAAAPQHVTSLNEAGTGILNDINNAGVVAATASGRAHLVTPDGGVSTLPAPGGEIEGATVNNYGATSIADSVVGGRTSLAVPSGDTTFNVLYGVVWDEDGARLLTTPEGGSSPVVANVTPDGHAVGSSTVASKESAILWGADGTPAVLPLPGVADYTHAAATSIAEGVVVGNTSKFAGNASFGGAATGWDAEGAVDLNTLVEDLPEGVSLQSASDINEAGQIVGTATTAAGARGYVLTPVAEDTEGEVTTIVAAPIRQVYGQSADLAIEVSPQATGTVTLHAGDSAVEADLTDGTATLTVPARALKPGRRSVSVIYEGVPGEFQPFETTVPVRVSKAAAVVGVKRLKPRGEKVERGGRLVLRIEVGAVGVTPTGIVVAKVAGVRQLAELNRKGRAKVRLVIPSRAKAGTKRVKVGYRGDTHVGRGKADPLRIRVLR